MDSSSIQLVLKAKTFNIPSKFLYLNDIDQNIIKLLQTHQKYEIKSNISYEVMQAFINYCLTKEIPDINLNNLYEYDQISQEFDTMKDLIELYKKILLSTRISPLLNKNIELKKQYEDKNNNLDQISNKYLQIIHILFENRGNNSYSYFIKYKSKLVEACLNENVTLIDLLTRKKVKQNGLLFVLNEETKTAGILQILNIVDKIFVPRSINYKSNEYLVTNIFEKSFNLCKKIKFAENSEIKIIDKKSFFLSSIKKILIPSHVTHILAHAFSYCYNLRKIECSENSKLTYIGEYVLSNSPINQLSIPSSVVEFKEGWCQATPNLNQIKIIQNEIQNISLFENKLIIGKSDQKNDIFDVLLFACRDIEDVSIPPFIRKISAYAFDQCKQLKTVKFNDDSNLNIIEKYAFCECSIENISIPDKVIQIDENAFYRCNCLNKVEFSKNCQLKQICPLAFYRTNLKTFSIPSTLVDLKEGWCAFTPYLTNIELNNNNNFIYIDKKIILGKSFYYSDVFDVILFANRNIKNAKILPFIKRIANNSFNECIDLYKVEFDDNSQLESIGEYAFLYSSILKISIPNKVKKIEKSAFADCIYLEKAEISKDSELESIDEFSFAYSKIRSLFIPSKIIRIGKGAFKNCKNLNIIEIDENLELKSIDKEIYQYSTLQILMIPVSLKNRLSFL